MTQDTELQLAGGFMTENEAAQEGYDERYAFNTEWQTRLVCFYGGGKRTKGRFHDGHEWNQRVDGGIEWSMKLAPKIGKCTLQVREFRSDDQRNSTWTAIAACD
jgi:HKD family nuclease